MPRIFNLSLHRSGTQSLHDLFVQAGLRSVHWPAVVRGVDYQGQVAGRETDLELVAKILKPVFVGANVVGDVPTPALHRQLAARFAHARFFVIRRPPKDWVRSVRRHVGERPFDPFERVVYWTHFRDRPESLEGLSDEMLIQFYQAHIQRLETFFEGSGRFRVFSLDEAALGQEVCRFCGLKPLPLGRRDYLAEREARFGAGG